MERMYEKGENLEHPPEFPLASIVLTRLVKIQKGKRWHLITEIAD